MDDRKGSVQVERDVHTCLMCTPSWTGTVGPSWWTRLRSAPGMQPQKDGAGSLHERSANDRHQTVGEPAMTGQRGRSRVLIGTLITRRSGFA